MPTLRRASTTTTPSSLWSGTRRLSLTSRRRGTFDPAEGVGATQVSRRAYVLDSQVPTYSAIAGNGCDITVQYVCADKCEPLSKYVSL